MFYYNKENVSSVPPTVSPPDSPLKNHSLCPLVIRSRLNNVWEISRVVKHGVIEPWNCTRFLAFLWKLYLFLSFWLALGWPCGLYSSNSSLPIPHTLLKLEFLETGHLLSSKKTTNEVYWICYISLVPCFTHFAIWGSLLLCSID